MTEIPSQLYLVECADGRAISIGERQARWCEEHGYAVHVEGPAWKSELPTPETLDLLIRGERDLRECDFCRAVPSGWRIKVRPFKLTMFGQTPTMRDTMYACDVCVGYVRKNEKAKLIDRAIVSTVEAALAKGGAIAEHAQGLPWHVVKRGLTPMVREAVYGMFANRQGYPERDE